jgi:uncharacterized membrane protein YphA (DoxX/SURF4 family)
VETHGARLFWAIALRDTAFSGGAFALAGSVSKRAPSDRTPVLVTLSRFFVGIPAMVFGVEDILHPEIAPGVPLDKITPAWIPGHLFWAYFSGAVLLVCGACFVVNKKARVAATYLGITILLVVLLIYFPIWFSSLSNIGDGFNFVADTLVLSGAALLLAGALGDRTSFEARRA